MIAYVVYGETLETPYQEAIIYGAYETIEEARTQLMKATTEYKDYDFYISMKCIGD